MSDPVTLTIPAKPTRHPSGKGLSTGSRWQPVLTFSTGVNPFVCQNGYAEEGTLPDGRTFSEHNVDVYGWECPREEFLHSPPEVTPSKIASKWALNPKTVEGWVRNHGWYQLREKNLEKRPADTGGLAISDVMAARRLAWVERRVTLSEKILNKIETILDAGVYDVISPNGSIKEIALTPSALVGLSKAHSNTVEIINTAMGVPSSITNQSVDVNHSMPLVNAFEQAPLPRRNPFAGREYQVNEVDPNGA